MATPPTLVSVTASNFLDTTDPEGVAVTTQAGDLVVVGALGESNAVTFVTPTGNGLTYGLAQSISLASNAAASLWTAPDPTGGSFTVSVDNSGSSLQYGLLVAVFRDSNGFGNSSKTNTSGAPSLGLTTGNDNSAILAITADWNAADGTSRTWRTVNGITPTAGNSAEKLYARDSGSYTVYGAVWSDAGAAGAKTVGLSAPSGQQYAIIAVEIQGSTSAAVVVPARPIVAPLQAATRAASW